MSLTTPPKSGNSEFKAVTARGLQPAICSLIVDMGTLEQEYQGTKKQLYKVYFEFTLQNGERVGKIFTYSFHEKSALTQCLIAWCNSKDFVKDLSKYVGSMVVLNLVDSVVKEKTYVNIQSFIFFDEKGIFKDSIKDFENVKCISFDYADSLTWSTFENGLIPQYILDKMMETKEFENWKNDKLK